jgi:hypothetical protein
MMSNLDYLTKTWELSPEQREQLDRYYILHWTSSYFLGHNPRYYETINHQGTVYKIVLYKCKWEDLSKVLDVRLSFRKNKEHKTGYVLVMAHKWNKLPTAAKITATKDSK